MTTESNPFADASRWRYFGRRGHTDIYELYRIAAGVTQLGLEHVLNDMERLHKDGVWRHTPGDQGLYREMLSGWFDDDEEVPAEVARGLYFQWLRSEWPGRD